MSLFRRLLIISTMFGGGEDTDLVLEFIDGIVILNFEGKGNKISISGTEVTLSE